MVVALAAVAVVHVVTTQFVVSMVLVEPVVTAATSSAA